MATTATSTSHASTTLTPPSSSHGNGSSWTYSTDRLENSSLPEKQSSLHTASSRAPLVSQNNNSFASTHLTSVDPTARKIASSDQLAKAARAEEAAYLTPQSSDTTNKDDASPADSTVSMHYGKTVSSKKGVANLYAEDPNDPNSHWIHRDKLARIENEELQAAGYVLPKARSASKARHRDKSVDNGTGSRNNSKTAEVPAEVRTPDITVPDWDLRLPEEVAETEYFISGGANGGSRIPVAKTSLLPIRDHHLERDSPVHKKTDGSSDSNSLQYPKARSRSVSASFKTETTPPSKSSGPSLTRRSTTDEGSPKKTSKGSPKSSATKKTRSGPGKGSFGSNGPRPSTRNGELSGTSGSKPMEGDPPWMISAYTPDPRLPPEEQLLPTVARRLQQERWEKEGKFGNVYDKEFRPLTAEGPVGLPGPSNSNEVEQEKAEQEWPLKELDVNVKAPSSPLKAVGYSTMPKIQDKQLMSPLPSPRSAVSPEPTTQISVQQVIRVPQEPEEEPRKKGCGCCIVM